LSRVECYGPILAIVLCAFVGCGAYEVPPHEAAYGRDVTDQLFDSAIGMLNSPGESSGDGTLVQVANRLNQWLAAQPKPADWHPDAMVGSLGDELRNSPLMQSLDELRFGTEDALALQQAVWLRDAARSAVGRETEPLARARLLFDWTVRQIELTLASDDTLPRLPWQIVLSGRGSADERAWVFSLLARQQGLDVVLLTADADAGRQDEPTGVLAALVYDGELWLFDPQLGLAIPGADGKGFATLKQAADEPQVLDQLAIEGEPPYRYARSQMQQMVAMLPVAPHELALRMQLIESRLAGPQRLSLSVSPSAVKSRIEKIDHIGQVQLWHQAIARWRPNSADTRSRLQAELAPFRALPDAPLWKGRVLHICGRLGGDKGAIAYYQRARPAEEDLQVAIDQNRFEGDLLAQTRAGKAAATYWLGIASMERGNFDAAIDYFRERVLADDPNGGWAAGARFNLGCTYEVLDRRNEAIAEFKKTRGPQRRGNLLRARQLEAADR
ncbi:MAG TPA: hypothetical protein VG713_12355, partial [Pirellulales bacterium]|nr:hypothetical protein [Pirellulales bacterium]